MSFMVKVNISDLFSSCNSFIVPFFERDYIYQESKIKKLLKEIRLSKYHYFDDLLFYEENGNYVIVDGQQRLVTYYLICCAVASKYHQLGEYDLYKQTVDTYLLNRTMFSLRGDDKIVLDNLVQDIIENGYHYLFKYPDSEVIKAFKYIYNRLVVERSFNDRHNINLIFKNLNSIKCEYNLINKYDAFSMFSKANKSNLINKNNSNVLIKNYFLEHLDNTDLIDFTNKWKKLEDLPKMYVKINNGDYKIKRFFDRFLRDYLTIKLDKIVEYPCIFDEFRNYHESSNYSINESYNDIFKYGTYYMSLFLNKEDDDDLRKTFNHITTACFSHRLDDAVYNGKKYYSYEEIQVFLLKVYNDYSNGLINKKEFIDITKYVESYIIRRDLCDITSNDLSNTFIAIYNHIDKKDYLNSFMKKIISLNKNEEFPDDDKLKGELEEHDFYGEHEINHYILSSIENSFYGIDKDFSNCEIEHILPKKITEDWKYDLGINWEGVHEQYLNTIGNLTLLERKYNRSVSNKSFIEKISSKNMGYTSSDITITRRITNWSTWNEKSIKERSNELTEKIIEIWPYPDINVINDKTSKIPETYPLEYYNLGKYQELFEKVSQEIKNINQEIIQKNNKYYISFQVNSRNIVIVYPNEDYLDIKIKLPPEYIDLNKLSNITYNDYDKKTIEIYLEKEEQLTQTMKLIKQSYQYLTTGKLPPKIQKYDLEHYGLVKGTLTRELFDILSSKILENKELTQSNTSNYITYKNKKTNIITIYNKEDYLQVDLRIQSKKVLEDFETQVEYVKEKNIIRLFVDETDDIPDTTKIINKTIEKL